MRAEPKVDARARVKWGLTARITRHARINPNTVQKAIMVLKSEGLVETVPGVGNRVAERPEFKAGARAKMLAADLEALVIRARQLHLSEDELVAAIHSHWNKL